MKNIAENIDFLRVLANSKQVEFVKLVQVANRKRLLAICEIFHNVLNQVLEVSEQEVKALRKHRKTLRKFCQKKLAARDKKLLVKNHGFLIQSILQRFLPQVEDMLQKWKSEKSME